MAGGWDSGVATPGGANFAAPVLNYGAFADWAKDFQQGQTNTQQQGLNDQLKLINAQRLQQGQQQIDLAGAFSGGLPTDPKTGAIDWQKAAQTLAKKGDIGDAVTMLQQGQQQPAPQSSMFTGGGGAAPASAPAAPLPAPAANKPQGDSGNGGTVTDLVTDRMPQQDAATGQTIIKIAQMLGVEPNAQLTPGQIRRAQGLLQKYAPSDSSSAGAGGSLPPSANAGSPAPQVTQQPKPAAPPVAGPPQPQAAPQPAPGAPQPAPQVQAAGQPGQFVSSLPAADATLNLTPQEKALYRRHLANLTGSGGVDNDGSDPRSPAGSRSTLFVNTFGIGGKTYVIPSVWNGKILSPDESLARAKKEGLDKFPSYSSEAEATARYSAMHSFMEKDTGQVLGARGGGQGQPAPQQPQAPQPQPAPQQQPAQPQGGPITPQVPLPPNPKTGQRFTDPQEAILALRAEAARLSGNPKNAGQVNQLVNWAERIEASIAPVDVGANTTRIDPRTGKVLYQGPQAASLGNNREAGATLDADAENYRQTGKLPPNMGRGIQGQAESNAIRTRAAEMEIAEGGNPADWSGKWQSFATQAAGKRALETRAAGLSLAENEASSLIPRVREISSKIKRTDYPTLNSLILAAQKGTGGQDVIKLGIAVESLVPVYARVLKPVGQVGQGDMARAHDILDKAWSDGQIGAALDQMQVELKSARTALDKTMTESENRNKKKEGDTTSSSDAGSGTAKWVTKPNGVRIREISQ